MRIELFIRTSRLTIRSLRESDIDEFTFYRSNAEVTKYQGFDVMTKEQAIDFIHYNSVKIFGKAGEWVQYAIAVNEDDNLIGDCAIKMDSTDSGLAEIGITISTLYQRKGFATEALLGVLQWLFETQEVHSILEIVDSENIASINLLKSAGFRQKGVKKENVLFKGKRVSEFRYAMTKTEWEKRNS